jgi:molybdopterin/thiamine biosynthesis adenylyltransferase
MRPIFTDSRTSIQLTGKPIPGAEDRQRKIAGFDQAKYSSSHILCIGAGGLISHIAPTLARKGIGAITLFDDDIVEVSNLNRQRFYERDLGSNKAIALAQNLQPECIVATNIRGYPLRFEEADARKIDLSCAVAICGVDNNPARLAASRHYRAVGIPVIFTAVSENADHGYVFIQDVSGPCIGCVFPDIVDDDRFPCPGTPAISDVLQLMGALCAYAVDALLMKRRCEWNYRRLSLSDATQDGASHITRANPICKTVPHGG